MTCPGQSRYHDVLPPIPPKPLEVQPFGTPYVYPYDSKHGLSISFPTWESTIAYKAETDEWRDERIKWCYPRFYINRVVRELEHAALKRLGVANDGSMGCHSFPTTAFAQECARHIANDHPGIAVDIVHFQSPVEHDGDVSRLLSFAGFAMAVFPKIATPSGMMFWVNVGGGISTRHAVFAKDHLDYLEASLNNKAGSKVVSPATKLLAPHIPIPPWVLDIDTTTQHVKSTIANLASPEEPSLAAIRAENVTLYPTGMSAIWHASQTLQTLAATSTVVAFGWMYDETIYNLKNGPWQKFLGYKRGTDLDLQDLTQRLQAGERIGALFCELPSNVFLSTVPLPRLRELADEYGFVIACDDTVGGFINLDLMPYVDVMMTSLTKMFSGASDVTGGSVIVNPTLPCYHTIQSAVQTRHNPAIVFPLDLVALHRNSQSIRWRAQRCNENALAVARMLHGHALIQRLHYPLFDESLPIYRQLMRCPKGESKGLRSQPGYGPVMSIVFHDPAVARRFYDALTLPKGPSFGTNFTIAVPFTLVVHYHNRDRVAGHGLPEHLIRISIGLEDVEHIEPAIRTALAKCTGEHVRRRSQNVAVVESKL